MNKAFRLSRIVKQWMVITLAALVCAPALVAAQAEPTSAPGLGNPLNRNPLNRRGLSDAAPVERDPRNSTTRPTLPSAPVAPDVRDVPPPAPDGSRDVPQPATDAVTPASRSGTGRPNF